MALESATYIHQLNSANPVGADVQSQGDDHIRLLKSTIQATFPNVAGAVTADHTELNYVDGVTSAIQTQLNDKLSASSGGAISARATFQKNSQTTYASAALESYSSSGDVHISLQAAGSTATSIKHTRGGSGVSIVGADGATLAPISASTVNAGGLVYGNGGGAGLGSITISTSAPSGGSSGDLWLRY